MLFDVNFYSLDSVHIQLELKLGMSDVSVSRPVIDHLVAVYFNVW